MTQRHVELTRRDIRRLRRKFERRCLGSHDIYSHVARDPLVIVPKNARGRRA
jgi:hypothetical protein